ncbi:MAG: nuclear transport factor 2 family protein [Acidobacteriota bacterium]|nr:nuclear transport factor 2 family protein [Acidobacteriota bacterium]
MTKDDFRRYLGHFNNKQYENLLPFYADDVLIELPAFSLAGPRTILDFYRNFHTCVREFVEAKYLVMDETGIAVEMDSRFECFRDFPHEKLPFRAGETRRLLNFVHYDLRNGKFKNVRVARYKQYS